MIDLIIIDLISQKVLILIRQVHYYQRSGLFLFIDMFRKSIKDLFICL